MRFTADRVTMPKRHTGQAPYGFRWAENGLVVNPDEATVRRLAFELFLEHRRKGTVARILNFQPPASSLQPPGVAEGVGFEPTIGFPMPVFKTGAFNRSATPP